VGPTCQQEKREKALLPEWTNLKRKHLLVNMPRRLGPAGPSAEPVTCGGSWCSEDRPDSEEDSKPKLIFKFQMNSDFGKTLRNFTRRFRRNLDMGIFLNFSRLFNDF
jgi:hypothetical protein